MVRYIGFDQIKEERTKPRFYKVFSSADLSSETMRAFPYNFIRKVSKEDLSSNKMVIRAKWGKSWDVTISRNLRFYYMERQGWDQFVKDNLLGQKEFITFTHEGNMIFSVIIYEENGKEMLIPRNLSFGIKKEDGECSYKNVNKEEETSESLGRTELEVKTSEKKMKRNKVENVVETGVTRKRKAEESNTFKSLKFKVTISKTYLRHYLNIPLKFMKYIPDEPTTFTVHHMNGNDSWKLRYVVAATKRKIFSAGWKKIVQEYPLLLGDVCTFKPVKPTELLLVVS